MHQESQFNYLMDRPPDPKKNEKRWDLARLSDSPFKLYRELLGLPPDKELKGKLILDIGSGTKEIFSKEASKKGIKVVSLSPQLSVNWARKLLKNNFIDWWRWRGRSVAGIAQELPFKDDVFDAEVSLAGVPGYLPSFTSEYRAAFKEIVRTLKPGGTAYLYPIVTTVYKSGDVEKILDEFSDVADIKLKLVEKCDYYGPDSGFRPGCRITITKKLKLS